MNYTKNQYQFERNQARVGRTEKQTIIAFQAKSILNIVSILCPFTATQKKMVSKSLLEEGL